MGIRENLAEIQENMERASARFGHRPEEITLVAVTKTVEEDRIREAIALGCTDVGENRVQEMLRKEEAFAGARLHMIGQLQKNKVRSLPNGVVMVQSIDRPALLEELDRIGVRDHRFFEGLVEVNIAGETQKGGIAADQVESLFDQAEEMTNVRLRGLMTVAPAVSDPEEVRVYFRRMRILFEKIKHIRYNKAKLDTLSMGMTHDYVVALEEGATMVRLGTAIFGHRN